MNSRVALHDKKQKVVNDLFLIWLNPELQQLDDKLMDRKLICNYFDNQISVLVIF